jgi:threonylcarbamoyladenosine tRNA methylthiotransferase MtaB
MDAVDLLVPNGPKTGLATYLPETPAHTPGPPRTVATDREALADPFTEPGVGLYPNHTRANLKVQEGCDFHCSYCIVPATRGRPRSRAWDDVLREAADLIERGHRELVLTGVNLALYRDGARTLPDLIQAVADLPGEFRLRLGSVEPGPTVPQLVRTMARNPRVCRFLHLSIQHGDDGILQAMNRRYSVAEFTDWAALATAEIPGLCLGTDVIAGFPGEDDGAFARSLETLARLPLGLVHVFSYSRREGTVAASLPGQVPSALTVERSRRLRRLAQDKAAGFARNAIGSVQEVLVERQNRNGAWEGWTDSYLRATLTGDPEDRPTAANTLRQVRVTAHLRGREVTAVPV